MGTGLLCSSGYPIRLISLGIIGIWYALFGHYFLSWVGLAWLFALCAFMRAGIKNVKAQCVLPGGTTRPKGNSFFVPDHL